MPRTWALAEFMKEYSLQEGAPPRRKAIPRSTKTLVVEGDPSIEVDEDLFATILRNVKNLDVVSRLEVAPSSRMRSLSFLYALPHIKDLDVFGKRIATLDGVEALRHPGRLTIDTRPNKRRSIEAVGRSRFKEVELVCGSDADLGLIGASRTVKQLRTRGCKRLDFSSFSQSPLTHLTLDRTSIPHVEGSHRAKRLRSVFVMASPKFLGFTGDNSGLQHLLVSSCSSFRLESVGSCPNLEFLEISKLANVAKLRDFPALKRLKTLALEHTKVDVAGCDLRKSFPSLKELWLFSARREDLARLSSTAPWVRISNSRVTIQSGVPIKR